MVEPSPSPIATPALAPIPDSVTFGPERVLTLNSMTSGTTCVLDLDSGKTLVITSDTSFQQNYAESMNKLGANVVAQTMWLNLVNMKSFCGLSDEAFATLSPGMALLCTQRMPPQLSPCLVGSPGTDDRPSADVFETQKGTVGVIQVINIAKNPPAVTFRYKILNPTKK
jgi:hypothetical protein